MAPYLALLCEDAPQRRHDLREVFNALRWLACSGAAWRLLPHDFTALTKRSISRRTAPLAASVFAVIVHDLRLLLRLARG